MTPEGICSREPRCRFDDCYFVIKVNRNKNESVTKQLIYSCAQPRRGSLGKASPCREPRPRCPCPFPAGSALHRPHHPLNTPVGNGGAGARCRAGEKGWRVKSFEVAQIKCDFGAPGAGLEQDNRVGATSRAPLPPRSVLLCPWSCPKRQCCAPKVPPRKHK